MIKSHPLDILQSYRLGSWGATTELQSSDLPRVHIDFKVLKLVDDVLSARVRSVILTGTAGDGKTYLAYKLIDRLGLDRATVLAGQRSGGYDKEGVFIDLDLSAGQLTEERVDHLHAALTAPDRLTLVCANEGKLDELRGRLARSNKMLPTSVLVINLSHRAIVGPEAWPKVLSSTLDGPLWDQAGEPEPDSALFWNRAWLRHPGVAERLRHYLLLPYLLGEPITIRETLSFLAYALGGGLNSAEGRAGAVGTVGPEERLRYHLFNTVFSEPGNFEHGGRAVPSEKLLWWIFRFDPADQASPQTDLRLLIELDKLDATPPDELLWMWQNDLVVRAGEERDTEYRRRLGRFIRYARRWYALASEEGFQAYFPFRHFTRYLEALQSSSEKLQGEVPTLIRGLNLLLSGGAIREDSELRLFYLPPEGTRQRATIYDFKETVYKNDLWVQPDQPDLQDTQSPLAETYLERFPRRLILGYAPFPEVRLPVSLMLYEVLVSAASATEGFPATLWSKERDAVLRFMSALGQRARPHTAHIEFSMLLNFNKELLLKHWASDKKLIIS